MRIIAMTLLALISSSLSLEASPTAQASELPRYFYYYLGEPVALEETAGTLAVFDRARGSADPLRQLLEDAAVPQPQVEPHPIGGWFLVRFDAESADAPPGIPSLITRLIGHDVTGRFFFSPVFRGPGGSPIIVPPEILVLFEDGVDEPDVARLLRDSRNLELTPFDVLATMVDTVRDLGEPGRDIFFGYGLVNAENAVKLAAATIFRDGFESGDVSRWSDSE